MIWVISLSVNANIKNLFIKDGDVWRNVYGDIVVNGDVYIGGVRISLIGSKATSPEGMNPAGATFSYFGWDREFSGEIFKSILLKNIYENIDLVINGISNDKVEYYFRVRPGGNVKDIKIRVYADIELKDDGVLIKDEEGKVLFSFKDIKAYQGSREIPIKAILEGNLLTFKVGNYDKGKDLIIDPTASLGSIAIDYLKSIYQDDSGYVYFTGFTWDYTTFNTPDAIFGTMQDPAVFVGKLSPDVDSLISLALISGRSVDEAQIVRKDPNGNVLIAGFTASYNFAPSRTVYGTMGSGDMNVFLTKLSSDLRTHIKTVIIAGTDEDYAYDIIIDSIGDIYIVGTTYSYPDFALLKTVIAGDTCGGGEGDIFITHLDSALNYIKTALICGYDRQSAAGGILYKGSFYIYGYIHAWAYDARKDTVLGTMASYDGYILKVGRNLDTVIRAVVFAGGAGEYAKGILVDSVNNQLLLFFQVGDPSTFVGGGIPTTVFGTSGGIDVAIIKADTSLRNFTKMVYIASPDSEYLNLESVAKRGDTVYLAIMGRDTTIGGSYCVKCNVASRDTFWLKKDIFVVGVSSDLNTCYGISLISGDGNDRVFSLIVRDNYILVGGYFYNLVDTASYPRPFYIFKSTYEANDVFVIKVSPRCLVNVKEKDDKMTSDEVSLTRNGIKIHLNKPSYLGFDVYTPDGRNVYTLSAGYQPSGEYSYKLNLPKGMYFIKVRVGDEVRTIKMLSF